MRTALLALLGCHREDPADPRPYTPPPGFVLDERVLYDDGLHNENTDLLLVDDRILLAFRGGETGQIGSDLAHINVWASSDGGATFEEQGQVSAANLPGGRDIRDPKLVSFGGLLTLNDLALTGVLTSADTFCGAVTGYAQVLGVSASDRIDLSGTTFGAARADPPAACATL